MMLCKMNFLCCGLLSSSENKAGYHRLSHDSDDHNAMDESAEQGGALSSPPPLNSDASMSSHRHEASSPTQDSFVSRLWGTTNQRSPLGRLYDQGFSRASGGRNIVQANTRSRTSRKKYGDEWGYDQEEGVELIDYDN